MNYIHPLIDFAPAPPEVQRSGYGTLLLAPDGNFWGVANRACRDFGTIFRMRPDGSGWRYIDAPVKCPNAGLVCDGKGFLWGTSSGERGSVFKVNMASRAVDTVFQFAGTNHRRESLWGNEVTHLGACPLDGLVDDGNGFLWGTTSEGGFENQGTVFKVDVETGAVTTVVVFTGCAGTAIGAHPRAGLVFDGIDHLWGTTHGGRSDGTIFKVHVNSGLMTVIARIWLSHGRLVDDGNGFLWGTTEASRIFNLEMTTGIVRDVASIYGGLPCSGLEPVAGLISDGRGFLWGTTTLGGSADFGTVFRVGLASWAVETVREFSGNGRSNKGSHPIAGLVKDEGGYLWGTTSKGGADNLGTVYKVDPATGVLTTLVEVMGPTITQNRRDASSSVNHRSRLSGRELPTKIDEF